MKITLILAVLVLSGCSEPNTSTKPLKQTGPGYVRSLEETPQRYYADGYSSVIFEKDSGEVISLDYVCQAHPPVWKGMRADIAYYWDNCRTTRMNNGWWISTVQRLPDSK